MELQQQKTGASQVSTGIRATKRVDTSAERLSTGVAAVGAVAKGLAKAQATEAAREFSGVAETRPERRASIDLFDQGVEGAERLAKDTAEGPISEQTQGDIREAQLNDAQLSARGLQEAVTSGRISTFEAEARANLEVQRRSNSVLGSLFAKDFQDAFSALTKNPSGSPAIKFNKSPKTIMAEAIQAERVKQVAKSEGELSAKANVYGTTVEQERVRRKQDVLLTDSAKRAEAQDKISKRTSQQVRSDMSIDLASSAVSITENAHAIRKQNGGTLDGNQMAEYKRQINKIRLEKEAQYKKRGITGTTLTAMTEDLDKWERQMNSSMEDFSKLKKTKAENELQIALETNQSLSVFKGLTAVATFAPDYANALAKMTPADREAALQSQGLDLNKVVPQVKAYDNITDWTSSQPNTKIPEEKLAGVMQELSLTLPQIIDDVVQQGLDSGKSIADLAQRHNEEAPASLIVAKGLTRQINIGNDDKVKVGITHINETTDDFANFRNKPDGEVTIARIPYKTNNGRVTRYRTGVQMPAGSSELHKNQMTKLYDVLKSTPTLWEGRFYDASDAFSAMVNDGYRIPMDVGEGESAKEKVLRERDEAKERRLESGEPNFFDKRDAFYKSAGTAISEFFSGDGSGRPAREPSKKGGLLEDISNLTTEDILKSIFGNEEAAAVADFVKKRGEPTNIAPAAGNDATVTDRVDPVKLNPEEVKAGQRADKTVAKGDFEEAKAAARAAAPAPEPTPAPAPAKPAVREQVKGFENNKSLPEATSGYDKEANTWKPHKSLEGGTKTLAYGHKLTTEEAKTGMVKIGNETVDVNDGITDAQAETLLDQDLAIAKEDADKLIASKKLKSIPPKAKEIIQQMTFQIGKGGVNNFKKMFTALQSGDYDEAATEMLDSKWAKKDSPERAKALAKAMKELG